jgi:glycerol-3-phosphate dehydrogenase (NAD(P)+)
MALAQTLAATPNTTATLWARNPEVAAALATTRRNPNYLPGMTLHPAVEVTADLDCAIAGHDLVLLAVPTHGMRAIAGRIGPSLAGGCPVVSAAKGFERSTGLTMTNVLGEVLGADAPVAAMSGPNIASEIAAGMPAATVIASADPELAAVVRDACSGPKLRVYSSTDPIGVEYGGALKNVIAIAAGIGDGIGAGDNGKAALMTRGLAEMARLGQAAGADPRTFTGLTGVGDCIVTCMSPHSRNRRLGELIGRGVDLVAAQSETMMIAEGVNAARAAAELGRDAGVEMPVVDQVCAILFDGKPVRTALGELMSRGARAEIAALGLGASDG